MRINVSYIIHASVIEHVRCRFDVHNTYKITLYFRSDCTTGVWVYRYLRGISRRYTNGTGHMRDFRPFSWKKLLGKRHLCLFVCLFFFKRRDYFFSSKIVPGRFHQAPGTAVGSVPPSVLSVGASQNQRHYAKPQPALTPHATPTLEALYVGLGLGYTLLSRGTIVNRKKY